jgi:hypothetical protein
MRRKECVRRFRCRGRRFPRAWQEAQGETDLKIINEMANFALLE